MVAVFNSFSAALSLKHSSSDISSEHFGQLNIVFLLHTYKSVHEMYKINHLHSPGFETVIAIAAESITARTLHRTAEKIRQTFRAPEISHACLRPMKLHLILVSRPPVFIFLCGREVIIHYSISWHFEGVVSWDRPNN